MELGQHELSFIYFSIALFRDENGREQDSNKPKLSPDAISHDTYRIFYITVKNRDLNKVKALGAGS